MDDFNSIDLRVVKDGTKYKFMNLEFDPSGSVTFYEPSHIDINTNAFNTKQEFIDYFTGCVTAINSPILEIETVLIEYLTSQASGITWQDVFDGTLVSWKNPAALSEYVRKAGYHYTMWTNGYIYYVDENLNYYKLNKTSGEIA